MAQEDTRLGRLTWEETDLCVGCSKDLDPEVSGILIEFQKLLRERAAFLNPIFIGSPGDAQSPNSHCGIGILRIPPPNLLAVQDPGKPFILLIMAPPMNSVGK